jgi:RNA polymerase sigma-70 factor (ECF subfamily)
MVITTMILNGMLRDSDGYSNRYSVSKYIVWEVVRMAAFPIIGGISMEIRELKKLSPMERQFADDNYNLIIEFLRKEHLNAEEFFDVVVFGYLLSIQIYLNDTELQGKCNFAACSYMYMKRAIYRHFREWKAKKRCSEAGANMSMEELEFYIGNTENVSFLEYEEIIKEIETILTEEQKEIFHGKLEGYSLKKVAEISGISAKRVYRQFAIIKNVVASVMEI